MSLDTYTKLWNQVLLYCPAAGPHLARDWIADAFRQVAERRRWSWMLKRGQFLIPAIYNTGTVAVTRSNATVTGTNTVWTVGMVGRQFRTSASTPIYTIASVNTGAQTMGLDQVWGGSNATTQAYSIWQCYHTAPTDFHSFVSVWDTVNNWQLKLHYTQNELNSIDPQRSYTGNCYRVASFDYYTPAGSTVPLPRYELWPHQTSESVYSFLYEIRAADLDDSGATLPRYIRGDVLSEGALASTAMWPGPSIEAPNPYFNLKLAQMHSESFERMVAELERQDDEVFEQNLSYMYPSGFGVMDSAWLQRHAV